MAGPMMPGPMKGLTAAGKRWAGRRHWLPVLAWPGLMLCMVALVVDGLAWRRTLTVEAQVRALTPTTAAALETAAPLDPHLHYAAGWHLERAEQLEPAIAHYTRAEIADDVHLAARAKLALGNVQLRIGLMAGDIAAGGSHVRGLAHLQLAREAYRGALRLEPELHAARYNLELLERLSPGRRVQGWSRQQENVQLQADEREGWATMKEGNTARGLP